MSTARDLAAFTTCPPPHGVALARCRLTDRPLRPCRRQTLIGSATRYCESAYRRPRVRTPLQRGMRLASQLNQLYVSTDEKKRNQEQPKKLRAGEECSPYRCQQAAFPRGGCCRRWRVITAPIQVRHCFISPGGSDPADASEFPDRHGRFSKWDRQAGPDRGRSSVCRPLHAPGIR